MARTAPLCAALLCACGAALAAGAVPSRPNIIFILSECVSPFLSLPTARGRGQRLLFINNDDTSDQRGRGARGAGGAESPDALLEYQL